MIIIIRTLILYLTVIAALRIMGKKQIGQLEPSELAVAIMVSEIASIPLASNDTPLLSGITPILILSASELLLSFITLKLKSVRKLITGHPTIIMKNGVIIEDALKKQRYTTDDLLVEMRSKGISDLNEISYAILETNGQVSFITKKACNPPTAQDEGIKVKEEPLAFPIITKGSVNTEYLKIIGRNEEWLDSQLKKFSLKKNEIFFLTANHDSIKFIQPEGGEKK